MLNGKFVKLREIEEKDLELFKTWRNSEFIRENVREYKPINMLKQKKWFESLLDSDNIMFAIEKNNELIGCCGLTYIDYKNGKSEVSIFLATEKWQSKGLATDALQLLLKYGFNELRLHRIYAIIFEYNKRSIKFFEKNNFKFDGMNRESRYWNGKYYNELIYSILENELKLI